MLENRRGIKWRQETLLDEDDLVQIVQNTDARVPTVSDVIYGVPVPKQVRIRHFDSGTWEEFIEEWAQSLDQKYTKVRRIGGAGDKGVDVMGFCSEQSFAGEWHNYQCKHYDHPLAPSDIWLEVGKVIYYSFNGEFVAPTEYYFVAPQGLGSKLEGFINDPELFRSQARENWQKYCEKGITSLDSIALESDLLAYFDEFDFNIFDSKSVVELVNEHSLTPHHTVRFGGGLDPRPVADPTPEQPSQNESRYIRKILDAYGDQVNIAFETISDLANEPALDRDLRRQRERFYSAESLRNFARDQVPNGTFSALQDELYDGVIDVCEGEYDDGHKRMKATLRASTQLNIDANALTTVTHVKDRQGMCHQLANDDKLTWVPEDE